ncbi:MAG: leucine-rich repeat protein, partial [Bacteroidaceae bacterium]|nr:leucine-rich repeat protein [Bacteroidaceae bacterium]
MYNPKITIMKKFKSLVLIVIGLLCSLSVSAHDFGVDGIYYNITSSTDMTVEVTYRGYDCNSYNNEYSGAVNIPESVTYNGSIYSVTSIGEEAFRFCSGLTSVVIPNSVTSIGVGAFNCCYRLTSVVIPNSVTSIGSNAFYDCDGLTSVVIPNSVTSIESYAFYDCDGLTSVEIGNSVTSIGSNAFYDCDGLTSLTIGAGVLSIGSNQCTPKKTIWLTNTPPSGWTNLKGTINYVANELYGSSSDIKVYPYLSSMFETNGIKYVPVSPSERTCDAIDCNYDSAVEEINIGETVSYRGVSMTVKNVMPYVAYGHKTVKKLSVSNKGDVGDKAFYGCTAITNATISNEGNFGTSAFEGAMTSENATINITNKGNIGDKAFYGCTAIANATISNEGNIGASAFEGAMTAANAELKVTNKGSIGEKAFYGCTTITNATISNEGLIKSQAFRGCSSLTSLTLGDEITTIGSSAFRECSRLTEVKIPNLVTQLEPYSFAGTTALKHVELGDSLQGIGNYCFSGSGLESISIPASVKNIGDYAFDDCAKLADVVIEDRTADLSLGSNGSSPLFADCPLDSVYIGGNITYNTSSS